MDAKSFEKARRTEVEFGKKTVDNKVNSDRFYTRSFTPEGRPFFIFVDVGDQIEGYILARRSNAHINRTNSFVIKCYQKTQAGTTYQYPDGIIEEFFANRQLQRIFEQQEAIGKYLRIVFIGKCKNSWTVHSTKLYRVFWEHGVCSKKEVELYEKTIQQHKQKSKLAELDRNSIKAIREKFK